MQQKETHRLVKLESLVHLAREAINEESTVTVFPGGAGVGLCQLCANRVFEQLDCNLHRDDSATTDMPADKGAKFGSFAFLLLTQKVPGWYQKKVEGL